MWLSDNPRYRSRQSNVVVTLGLTDKNLGTKTTLLTYLEQIRKYYEMLRVGDVSLMQMTTTCSEKRQKEFGKISSSALALKLTL